MVMESSRKLGKHEEDPRGQSCVDRIGSLPDEVLGYMLSFLPTKCAVGTSILSVRWRYLFTLTNCLSFNDASCFRDSSGRFKDDTDGKRRRGFREFVYKVLESHQISPIKKFKLCCRSRHGESDLNAWVSNAVQKGAQEIHYEVVDAWMLDCLVMCQTLVRLTVIGYECYAIKFPPRSSIWLPNLRILYLDSVRFSDNDSMQGLFSSCKLLEELTLNECHESHACCCGHVIISTGLLKVLKIRECYFGNSLVEIDAPNLAYLTYKDGNTGVKIVPSWRHSRSLIKAVLKINCYKQDRSFENSCTILRAAADKTTDLHLSSDSLELLFKAAFREQMPVFHSLTSLDFGYFSYDSWKYATRLVDKSPQLKTLVFEQGIHHCNKDLGPPPSDSLIPFSCPARVIEVYRFCGHECSLLLLRHFLRNAKALTKLIIHTCSHDMLEELKKSKLLLMLLRESRDCCIELK